MPPNSDTFDATSTTGRLPPPLSATGRRDDNDYAPPPTPPPAGYECPTDPAESHRLPRKWSVRAGWQLWNDRRAPAVLISLIVHTSLFLLLAIWTMHRQVGAPDAFDFRASVAETEADLPSPEMVLVGEATAAPTSQVIEFEPERPTLSQSQGMSELSELLQIDGGMRERAVALGKLQQLFSAPSTSISATFAATGIDDRDLQHRQQVALRRGGTIESEQAVEAALEWLAAHQTPSGAWSLVHDGGACNGRCGNNGCQDRFDAAATGLSLLAFMGAGYTHRDGKHRETVRRGIYFLLQIMEETAQGGSFLYQSERGMYNHGIAAFALCEAYQMTADPELKKATEQTVKFICNAQNYQGGWGYLPKQPGDLTISGWQVMALKSAAGAGLEIPPNTVLHIDEFLETQRVDRSFAYQYRQDPGISETCTAIGMLLRLFRGMSHTDPHIVDGMTFLQQHGASPNDVYFNYYATLVLFHLGGATWEDWHPRVREHLIITQATQGHEAGSWYFENVYGKEGGRLYTTAMAAMTLEVYYRFSPLYQQADKPFEL
ncbi:MAG: prenyltransferase/squalene oxidase repeat-containing protein [Pirellulaceae bacterium]